MSDDDFGTVNVRRGDRAREIELLRKHYREHRDTLGRLAAEAPTEYLAGEYHRLIGAIDSALGKIDDLEGRPPAVDPHGDPLRAKTEPGTRTLITPNPTPSAPPPPPPARGMEPEHVVAPAPGSRLLLMAVAALVVLAIIGYLIYRASGDRRAATSSTTTIAESTAPVTNAPPGTIEPVTPAPATTSSAAARAGALSLTPAVADYGTIRRGTRAARQIEVTNSSNAPISIKVARSQCKCLFYEYKDTIAPKKKETITVTVDGARAKAGTLAETIDVTSKADPSVSATFEVSATIK